MKITSCPSCYNLLFQSAIQCPTCHAPLALPDGQPGTQLWATDLPHKLPKPYAQGVVWQQLFFIPLVAESYGRQRRGVITAYNLQTSTAMWTYQLPPDHIAYHLLISHNLLLVATEYVGSGLGVSEVNFLALDPATGTECWQRTIPGHSIYPPTICDDTLLLLTNRHWAYLLQLPEGQIKKELELPTWHNQVAAVDHTNQTFYLGFRTGLVWGIEATTAVVTPLYQAPAGHSLATIPTHAQQTLYIVDRTSRELYAITTPSGDLRWQAPLGRGHTSAPAVGQHLYIGVKEREAHHYTIRAYDLATGELSWQFTTDRHIEATPVVQNGQLFIGSLTGTVYALDEATGHELWSHTLEPAQRVISSTAVGDTHLIIGTREGQLSNFLCQAPPSHTWEDPTHYRHQNDYYTAALAELDRDNLAQAAQDFVQARHPYPAAQLYAHLGQWATAGAYYIQAAQEIEAEPTPEKEALAETARQNALHAYIEAEDLAGQAEVHMALGQYEAAAQCYKELHQPAGMAYALEKAGRLHEAALLYIAAHNYHRASELYRSLKEFNMLATTLIEMGEIDEAVSLLVKTGRLPTAVDILLQHNRQEEAIDRLLTNKQYIEAGDLYLAAAQYQQAAETYIAGRHWLPAAQAYEQMGATLLAAETYEKADRLSDALRLYSQEHKWRKAWELVPKLRGKISATQTAKQTALVIDDLAKASGLWESAASTSEEVGLYLDAARYYGQAKKWDEAARLYEQVEQIEKAARCWGKANQPARGAELAYQYGYRTAAAQLWEEAGELVEAAKTWAEIPNLAEAARLYADAGEVREAFAVLTHNEMWDIMRSLAKKFNEPEQEARACLELAKRAKSAEREDLYLAAGYAFQRAAEAYEEAEKSLKPDSYIADLWAQAAEYLEKGLVEDGSEISYCLSQVIRLRKWPSLNIEIKPTSPLIEGMRSFLEVTIKNEGYGSARYIACKVMGTHFGEELNTTRHLRGLRPQVTDTQQVSVCPQEGMVGTAVPIEFQLTYQRPDEVEEKVNIKGYVDVRNRDSQQMTPPHSGYYPSPATGSSTAQTVIYAGTYIGGHQISGDQINAGGQKGDKVEIKRESTPPSAHTTKPVLDHCPHCQEPLVPQARFCTACGHKT